MPCESTTSGPLPVTSQAIRPPGTSTNSVMSASLADVLGRMGEPLSHHRCGCGAVLVAGSAPAGPVQPSQFRGQLPGPFGLNAVDLPVPAWRLPGTAITLVPVLAGVDPLAGWLRPDGGFPQPRPGSVSWRHRSAPGLRWT